MSNNKLEINKNKYNINLKFYFFLKHLVKVKLTDTQTKNILEKISLYNKVNFDEKLKNITDFLEDNLKDGSDKKNKILLIFSEINNNKDFNLFLFSLKLYSIKDLLLQEAKTKNLFDISKLDKLNPLSLEYDKITTYSPYSTRVNGALLSLLFFNKLENNESIFLSKTSDLFIRELSKQALSLKKYGVEPNQIFMLMFNESINQSIISDSGSNYEDRIKSTLIKTGLKSENIHKMHDKNNTSTEFDFFFELSGKTYGIGAKRTLRERYKQFIKTTQMSKLDVMIEITLGTDVRKNIAEAIVKHGVFLFVADEVYDEKVFLKKIKGVYPSRDFNLKTLRNLNKL